VIGDGRKRFFFEKKKQKTFTHNLSVLATATVPGEKSKSLRIKVFCFFFSKKKRFLPVLARATFLP